MAILAIDPGVSTGWALLDEAGSLLDCGLGDPRPCRNRCVSRVVIERPQIYRGRASKGDPNDLITLAILVGRYTEAFSERIVEHILPHDWKGSVDADVLCRRVVASLSNEERTLLFRVLEPLARKPCSQDVSAGLRHNVIDAVGIAKWSTKRARAGVF